MRTLQIVVFSISAFLVFTLARPLFAVEDSTSKEEMSETTSQMDDEAKTPEGQKKVTERLAERYNVDEKRIADLRDQHLGYGEIDKTLGLAKQMPGGITDDNIKKVTQLRQGDGHKTGWGNVAKELNLKPGSWHSDQSEALEHKKSESSEHMEHPAAWKDSATERINHAPAERMEHSGSRAGGWASHGGGGGRGK